MLEFTSTLGLDRVTTDITLTATIIRIVITTGRIRVTPITGRTTGTADTDITTATIVTTIITDTKVTWDLEIETELARKQFRASSLLRDESFPAKKPALLFWINRLRRFSRGTFGRLVNLELFLQLLNQRR